MTTIRQYSIEFKKDAIKYVESLFTNFFYLIRGYGIQPTSKRIELHEFNVLSQVGIVGCVSIYEYEDDTIKKHELTRKAKEEDRIKHFDACDGNTEPVFLTYKKNEAISKILDKTMKEKEPEYDFTGPDDTRHILWTIGDEGDLDAIKQAFSLNGSRYPWLLRKKYALGAAEK